MAKKKDKTRKAKQNTQAPRQSEESIEVDAVYADRDRKMKRKEYERELPAPAR